MHICMFFSIFTATGYWNPSANEVSLKNIGKLDYYPIKMKNKRTQVVFIIPSMNYIKYFFTAIGTD